RQPSGLGRLFAQSNSSTRQASANGRQKRIVQLTAARSNSPTARSTGLGEGSGAGRTTNTTPGATKLDGGDRGQSAHRQRTQASSSTISPSRRRTSKGALQHQSISTSTE